MRLIDTFPTNKIRNLEYRVGRVFPFGATITDGGVNFSIFSKDATSCTLVLFHHGSAKPYLEIPFPEEYRIGNVYTMMVFGLNVETTEYGYRFGGPNDPEKGYRFDRNQILLDPYAKSISGRSVWGKAPDPQNIFPHRGQIIREDYEWEGDKPLETPVSDLVIYEMHVRSYTAHPSSGIMRRGTFSGLMEKIPYLKELGVNCIELMPVFAFDEFENSRTFHGRRLMNYWGYSTIGFFAPKAGYAAAARYGLEADELKYLIRTLHKNGIEVILDVVFNHTGEGGDDGPCISYKGIDNRTYYLLDDEGKYQNYSGCGNTMNCNHPVVRTCILDSLRYWVSSYHVDGFRFDLASIMSRDRSGTPMMEPPVLDSIAHDPILGKCKLIAEAWDAGGLYQVGRFPSWNRWSEWNGKYRDCVRRFIKGDAWAAPELYHRIRGSDDLYGGRSAAPSINFVTCHDGFTLHDLVSYNEKHNLNNGENNRDGSGHNESWNCGAEGDTSDPVILALRQRQMRNFMTMLFMSRGVPMILAGDEFANSQNGNNNAYCQDNEISWLDWNDLESNHDLFLYVKHLIAFRQAHPILRAVDFRFDHNDTGYPELSFHSVQPWNLDESAPAHTFGFMYAEGHGKYGVKNDCFIYAAFNAHWESHVFTMPIVPAGFRWHLAFNAEGESFAPFEEPEIQTKGGVILGPRSSAVFTAW